jgi:hypothetical protein
MRGRAHPGIDPRSPLGARRYSLAAASLSNMRDPYVPAGAHTASLDTAEGPHVRVSVDERAHADLVIPGLASPMIVIVAARLARSIHGLSESAKNIFCGKIYKLVRWNS